MNPSGTSNESAVTVAKPWYLSRTIWGAVLAAAASQFPRFIAALGGVDAGSDQVVQIASSIATLAGASVAIYGRFKATQIIG